MLEGIVASAPIYLLVAVRCFALIMTLPLFAIRSVSRISKIALTAYMAYLMFPSVDFSAYAPYLSDSGSFSVQYVLLLVGEALIGFIMGFFVTLVFAAFSTAGQFFAFQMGFSASEVYDALSQVENPLMGQFFNLVAMLIFLQNHWAVLLFSKALGESYNALNAISLVAAREQIVNFLLSGLTVLFAHAFVIALPIMGTLFLISVTMGILSKAAPQMNLMSEGFPIMLLTAFFIIFLLMEPVCDYFMTSFLAGFRQLEELFTSVKNGGYL